MIGAICINMLWSCKLEMRNQDIRGIYFNSLRPVAPFTKMD